MKSHVNIMDSDSYLDALKVFPDMDGKKLLTKKGDAFLQKTDIFKRVMWFSYRSDPGVFIPLSVESVKSILEDNAKGETPNELIPSIKIEQKLLVVEPSFENNVGQESLTRFDRKGGNKPRNNNQNKNRNNKNKEGQKPKQNTEQSKPQNKQQAKPQGNKAPQANKPQQNANKSNPNKQHQNKPRPQHKPRQNNQKPNTNNENKSDTN